MSTCKSPARSHTLATRLPLPHRTSKLSREELDSKGWVRCGGCQCGNISIYGNTSDESGDLVELRNDQLVILHEELAGWKSSSTSSPASCAKQRDSRPDSPSRTGSRERGRGRQGHAINRSGDGTSNRGQSGVSIARSGSAEGRPKEDEKHSALEGETLVCAVCEVEVLELLESDRDERRVRLLLNARDDPSNSHLSPLYSLSLASLTQPSEFGLPPSHSEPLIASASSSSAPLSNLQPSPDPFFLPPPFTPASPYFQDFAATAVDSLSSYRSEREDAIEKFIKEKRDEVEAYEAKLRREAELIWQAYQRAREMRGSRGSQDRDDSGSGSGHAGNRAGSVTRRSSFPVQQSAGTSSSGGDQQFGTPSSASTRFTTEGVRQIPPPPPSTSDQQSQVNTSSSAFPQANGGSLLSASLSQNSFLGSSLANQPIYFPNSPNGRSPRTPSLQNPVTQPYRAPRSGVDLDMASSLRVSHMRLPGENGTPRARKRGDRGDPAMVDIDPSPLGRVEEAEEAQDDSQIAEEEEEEEEFVLNPFGESTNVSERSSYQDHLLGEEDRTPRIRTIKVLSSSHNGLGISVGPEAEASLAQRAEERDERAGRGGQNTPGGARKKVKFEESAVVEDERRKSLTETEDSVATGELDNAGEADVPPPSEAIGGEDVFDFEDNDLLDDDEAVPRSDRADSLQGGLNLSGIDASLEKIQTLREETSSVHRKLVELHAADTPSHRAAWRNNKDTLWNVMGKGGGRPLSNTSSPLPGQKDLPTLGEQSPSQLGVYASSVPIKIAFPRERKADMTLEPKTSLTDRQGILVPPLKPAMRKASGFARSDQEIGSIVPPLPVRDSAPPSRRPSGSTSGERSRGPSAAYSLRERDSVFANDPGPALEAVEEMGRSADPEDIVGGASFVPPHRLAPDRKPSDGGWRAGV